MSKPWDKLRVPPVNPLPIGAGNWNTTHNDAAVSLRVTAFTKLVYLDTHNGVFGATDLRELAEFCNELADQLEST